MRDFIQLSDSSLNLIALIISIETEASLLALSKSMYYDNICSFHSVVVMFCSTVAEKLDRKLFTTRHSLTILQTFPNRLERDVTMARHIGFLFANTALVSRPKFTAPS